MTELEKLTELFRKLGAPEPERMASSQLDEGINQLGRFLFLRQAWKLVVDENDHSWMQFHIDLSSKRPDDPCSGIGPALERILKTGASPQDITDVVRVMQYELLFNLCYLMDDPCLEEPEVRDVLWRLVQIDADGKTIGEISGLYESLLGTDPTGREMRPRKSNREG